MILCKYNFNYITQGINISAVDREQVSFFQNLLLCDLDQVIEPLNVLSNSSALSYREGATLYWLREFPPIRKISVT